MSGDWHELFVLLGTFVGTAFAIVRYAMATGRDATERFMDFLGASVERQDDTNRRFQEILERHGEIMRENSALLQRLSERLNCRISGE
ncbi:MAG: hypothetical protein SNJ74_04690 [Fimbriimonadaceae bacterium]